MLLYMLYNRLYAFQLLSRCTLYGILPLVDVHGRISTSFTHVNTADVTAFKSARLAKESKNIATRHLVFFPFTYI